jgi:cytosine/adenosine deaminase-related metal-dependent hydrolase
MNGEYAVDPRSHGQKMFLSGARIACGPERSSFGSIEIAGGRVAGILTDAQRTQMRSPVATEIDLSGFVVLPGLINAHDHLEFSLYPRLADPPYRNYVDWGEDIHRKFADVIAKQHTISRGIRLWWGAIRNLLCGVTTVSHHNPLWPELRYAEFPVRVVSQYEWAHSPALGGDLRAALAPSRAGHPFIIHACEGTDDLARSELWQLEQLGLLDEDAVLVHGLAIDRAGVALINGRRASLIVCPSSNSFLYGALPDMETLGAVERLALGSDSPLTAKGDLLDEVRFAIHRCGIPPESAYRMVTTSPASILRLGNGEGSIRQFGVADLIAVRDAGTTPAEQLCTLSAEDIELVMIGGRVQLASEALMERLPARVKHGLEPLFVCGIVRWLRAPVRELLHAAKKALGKNHLHLGDQRISAASLEESSYAN